MDDKSTGHRWIAGVSCAGALLLLALVAWRFQWADHLSVVGDKKNSRHKDARSEFKGWRASKGTRTAGEIVTSKVVDFGRNRRKVASALARRAGVEVPHEVTQFFDAVEKGDWSEIDAIFNELSALMRQPQRPNDLEACWPAVMDTLGCVAEARKWPAEKLLDYADAILGSLSPGMVFVGGTDPGRFIPTLVNETSGGEQHVVITQNALADRLYLDYIGFLYQDRIVTLSQDEQDAAFADYIADAKRRLEHDLQFPDEPKQLAPGEHVRFKDEDEPGKGEVIAEGAISVMAVNERLLRRLMEKNPTIGFALEESFPMKSTYSDATVLGPILQVQSGGADTELTPEKAAQAIQYWRQTSDEIASDPESSASFPVKATWSKMAAAQANLFTDRKMYKEAEETYRLAMKVFPGCPEASYGLAGLLALQGEPDAASGVIEDFQSRSFVEEPSPDKFPRVRAPREPE